MHSDSRQLVATLHSRGLVHCDVTPQNILSDPDDNPRLIDFGLAYGWGPDGDDESDHAIGTVEYASPEQTGMLDRPVDGRSDLYELGAVLFHCATGRPPYEAESRTDLKRRHANATIPDPREARPELPKRLARLIETLLAEEPTDRPTSAQRVLTEFHRCETDQITSPRQLLQTATRTSLASDDTFVGRRRSQRRLRELWDRARRQGSRSAMIVGPAGSGKTALVEELLADIQRDGPLVLQVEGLVEEPYPYAPIRRMLAPVIEYIESLEPDSRPIGRRLLEEATADYEQVLHPILPELAGDSKSRDDLPEAAGSEQVFQGVASMLGSLADQAGGAVIVVDDAHQLDDATLEILERVTIQVADAPMLLVAVCDEEAPAGRLDDLEAALSENLEFRTDLGPMNPEAVEELIRAHLADRTVDRRLVERIATLSHGNPYAASAYVRAVLDAAVLRPTWEGWEVDEAALEELELPEELSALLVERIERLSDRAMDVIAWMSVFTTSVDLDKLTECIEMPRPELQRALGEAHRHRLVEVDASGRYALVHDELRRAALERLDDQQLRDRHQRAAEVLDDGSDDPDKLYQIAHHYARGRVADNPQRAFEFNDRASQLAADRLAYEQAFQFIDRADQIAGDHDLATDATFHQTFAEVADRTNRLEVALEHTRMALERSDDDVRRARFYRQLADISMSSYDVPRGREYVERGFEELGESFPDPSAVDLTKTFGSWMVSEVRTSFGERSTTLDDERLQVLCELYTTAALVAYFSMDVALMVQTTVRELRLAQRLGDASSLAQAHSSLATMLTLVGLDGRGEKHMQRARQFADQTGDPFAIEGIQVGDALNSDFRGEPLRAEGIFKEMLCEQPVMLETLQYLSGYTTLIQHLNMRGHFRDAVTSTERARKLLEARFGDQSRHLAVMFSNLTLAYTVLGIDEDLERLERVAERHKPDPDNRFHLGYYYQAKLAVRVERGQWGGETDELVEEYRDLEFTPDNTSHYQALFFVYLGFLRLHQLEYDVVDRDRGLDRLDRVLGDLEELDDTPVYNAYYTVFRAARARITDDLEAAREHLRAAQETADMHDIPLVSFEVARNWALVMHRVERDNARDRYVRNAIDIASKYGWETHLRRLRQQFVGMIDRGVEHQAFGSTAGSTGSTTSSTAGTGTTGLTASWADEQMASLRQIGELVTDYGEVQQQLDAILEELLQLFGGERARLYSIDSDAGLVERSASNTGDSEPTSEQIRPVAEHVYRNQEVLFVSSDDETEEIDILAETDIRSLLAVPVRFRGRLSGILYLDSRLADGVFEPGDRTFVELVAFYLLLLLESSRARELERKLADAEKRSAALLEHATRAVQIGVATMEPNEALARISPTVHKMAEPWPSTAVWWDRIREEIDWPEAHTCEKCGEPEYVGEMLADITTPTDDDGDREREVFEITSTGHGHELTETSSEHVLLVRNITEQFETNERLKQMNRQLKRARDQAMAASEAKSKFLARMSHEFRTPLNAVLGYTELLLENVDDLEADQMADDLAHIQTSAEQLKRLIGDVLDLTKIDSGRLDLEVTEVDLEAVADDLTTTLRPLLDETGNELVVESDTLDVDFQTDETKLRQLLMNLLRNAAKFTEDGTITLSVDRRDDEQDPRVVFEVADTGIGMTEEEQAEIFEPFFQADDSSTSEYRGTGLGLTLVQRFAERMDGSVDVDSTPGEGTTFRLELSADLQLDSPDDDQLGTETTAV